MIDDPGMRRLLGQCFYLHSGGESDDEVAATLRDAMSVERAVDRLLDDEIEPDDFLDLVVPHIPSVDAYLSEIVSNIEDVVFL